MNDALRDFRLQLGKTIPEMAKIVGVSQSYYDKIERGERQPGYGFLRKFVKAFPHADLRPIFFAA